MNTDDFNIGGYSSVYNVLLEAALKLRHTFKDNRFGIYFLVRLPNKILHIKNYTH